MLKVRSIPKHKVDVKQILKLARSRPLLLGRRQPPVKTQRIQQLAAGLLLTSGIALLATFLHTLPGLGLFSPLILAILLGILVRNTVGIPQRSQLGVTFSLKRILKLAIILLGLQLSLEQVIEVGPVGLGIVAFTLISTFVFTCWFGKRLGVSQKLSQLIAAGTSICGATAVIATNVVVEGHDEDVAYAVAMVTLFGTISMLLYPVFPGLHLSPQAFGIWCGASIHEVAQVIAAAFQNGHVSGQVATISKLSRVMLLAPMVLMRLRCLSQFALRGAEAKPASDPNSLVCAVLHRGDWDQQLECVSHRCKSDRHSSQPVFVGNLAGCNGIRNGFAQDEASRHEAVVSGGCVLVIYLDLELGFSVRFLSVKTM